jgi:hypothetical protein
MPGPSNSSAALKYRTKPPITVARAIPPASTITLSLGMDHHPLFFNFTDDISLEFFIFFLKRSSFNYGTKEVIIADIFDSQDMLD